MDFSKNTQLLQNICLVQIKSIDSTVNIPSLTPIYHTPSKIKFNSSNSSSKDGVIINKKLSIFYPGLSTGDFDKFNDLVRGEYQVFVKLDNDDIYEIASDYFPMSCSTTFSIEKGHTINFSSGSPIPVKYRDNQPVDGINVGGFNYDFDFYVS